MKLDLSCNLFKFFILCLAINNPFNKDFITSKGLGMFMERHINEKNIKFQFTKPKILQI